MKIKCISVKFKDTGDTTKLPKASRQGKKTAFIQGTKNQNSITFQHFHLKQKEGDKGAVPSKFWGEKIFPTLKLLPNQTWDIN